MTVSDTRPMREQVEEYIKTLQGKIVQSFEDLDPSAPKFKRDSWIRPQGGSGQSCVFACPSDGLEGSESASETILEKAGVNISIVYGILPPAAIKQMRADHTSMPLPDRPQGLPFFAAGISLVIHPRNPHAPTVHANYRYFEITEPTDVLAPPSPTTTTTTAPAPAPTPTPTPATQPKVLAWWFGGGCDLTPSYLYPADAAHFHRTLKAACDAHGAALYPAFKHWCDEYFYLPHRAETRGIGGLFFDDLNEGPHQRLNGGGEPSDSPRRRRPKAPGEIFEFVRQLGDAFIPSYFPILERRHRLPFTPAQRRWQLVRRGRYVEFNLVYDRGTKFGLMTPGARIESILMSLPETARWEYMCDMGGEGTEEGKLVEVLKKPRDWV